MSPESIIMISLAIFLIAFLYSTVGHAGASGYIAVMTLFSIAPIMIKPTALTLNIIVALISTVQFYRAGFFSFSLFWPFALLSVPFAYLGGYMHIPSGVFRIIVGMVLLFSAYRFFFNPQQDEEPHPPKTIAALPIGAGLGFVSGLTGVGGGIFLTPLLLVMKWAKTKTAAAVSAPFILVNSISGLAGNISNTQQFPIVALPFVIAAVIGGSIGSFAGSKKFSTVLIKRFLALILLIAGSKLLFIS